MQHSTSAPLVILSRRRLLAGAGASAALALASCGGGGGDSLAGVGSGGTGSFTSGTIHGFGSVVVAGVHFDETAAAITGDAGQAMAADALRLGMVAQISGSDISIDSASGKRRANARTIALRSEIEGPISAIDLAAGMLTVLGQSVQVGADTVFDDDLPRGLSSLAVGHVVEVHGLQSGPGAYRATRVEREDDVDDNYKLRGVVADLNLAARTLRLGQAVVSLASLAQLPAGLANGQYLRVELARQRDAAGRWVALRLQVSASGASLPQASGAQVQLEGFITAFTSSVLFSVNGVVVDASNVTRLPVALALGSRVEVEGRLQDGVLKAREVELEDDDDDDEGFEIEGRVTHLDTAAQTLQVRGVRVSYVGARFKGGTAAQLRVGVEVEVKGRLAADGSTIAAVEVEFDD
jgi:hypothetical protein